MMGEREREKGQSIQASVVVVQKNLSQEKKIVVHVAKGDSVDCG